MAPLTVTLLSGFGFAHCVNSIGVCFNDNVTVPIPTVTTSTVADTRKTVVEMVLTKIIKTLSFPNATASKEPGGSLVPFNVSKWRPTATYNRAVPTTLSFTMTDFIPEGLTIVEIFGINSAGSVTWSTLCIQGKPTHQPNSTRWLSSSSHKVNSVLSYLPSSYTNTSKGLPHTEFLFTTSAGRRLPVNISMSTHPPTESSTFMTVASSALPAVAEPSSTALTSTMNALASLSRNAKIGIGVGAGLGAVLMVMLAVLSFFIITSIILKGLIRNISEHNTHDVDEEGAYKASVSTEN